MWSIVRNVLLIDWCSRSHMALACGFLTVVVTSLIPLTRYMCKKAAPVNSPPLSYIQHDSRGYHANQFFSITYFCVQMIYY